MNRIYLDHNATTPLDPRAREAMLPWLGTHFGNPSSLHGFGREAREAVDEARARVAAAMGAANPREVIFTASGSEANCLAVLGTIHGRALAGRRTHLVVSAIEHSSVLQCAAFISAASPAVTVSHVAPGADGVVPVDAFLAAIRPGETVLASLMFANNETGALQPIAAVGAGCRERGVLLHVDAVQAAGKTVGWRANELVCDFITMASHKLYGPTGAAALWCRGGVPLLRQIHGGEQEAGRRGGTENVAALAGFGRAAQLAGAELEARARHLAHAQATLEARLRAGVPEALVLCSGVPRIPGTTQVLLPAGCNGALVAAALDLAGFSVSTGSACAAGTVEPSHVLLAMGHDHAAALRGLRISAGTSTHDEDMQRFVLALAEICARRVRL